MTELVVVSDKAGSFTSLPVEIEKTTTTTPSSRKNINYLRSLPADILQEIILYYTNTKEGLLTLRCICQEFKTASESSLLWLYCSLTFYCPVDYLQPMKNHPIWNNFEVEDLMFYMKEDITTFLDSYENIITLIGLFQVIVNERDLPPTCKVICDAEQQRKMLSSAYYRKHVKEIIHQQQQQQLLQLQQSSSRLLITRQNDIQQPQQSSTILTASNLIEDEENQYLLYNRFEIAKEISTWFLLIFRQYQLHWRKEIQHLNKYYYYHELFVDYFDPFLVPISFCWTNILFLCSIYGFATLQGNVLSGTFGWENHFSFSCIYTICVSYWILTIMTVVQECLFEYRRDETLRPKLGRVEKLCGYDALSICFLGIVALVGMVHAKAVQMSTSAVSVATISGPSCKSSKGCDSSGSSSYSFSWSLTVTPIWVTTVICLLLGLYELYTFSLPLRTKKLLMTVFSSLLLVAASSQLLASYYDSHSISDVGFAVIPLFPLIFALLLFGISMVGYIIYYWFYQGLIFHIQTLKRSFLFSCGAIYILAIFGMIGVIIILVLESFLGYQILIPTLTPVGEFALLTFCINLVVTIHLYLASPKNRLSV